MRARIQVAAGSPHGGPRGSRAVPTVLQWKDACEGPCQAHLPGAGRRQSAVLRLLMVRLSAHRASSVQYLAPGAFLVAGVGVETGGRPGVAAEAADRGHPVCGYQCSRTETVE